MKTPRLVAISLSFMFAELLTSTGFAQGSLTPPPGAPAPTMKTLDQIEARTIVNATNTPGDATNTFIIRTPGSYYLTGNITGASGKHGISVLASNVTLDLNGFALIGTGAGGATRGVTTTTAIVNFSIRNGNVRGWSGGGVWAGAAVTLAEKLLLSDNVGGIGLAVGNGSLVKDCVASGNTTGFFCPDRTQINNCIATVNTDVGFRCTAYVNLIDCTSSRNGGHGIVTLGACSLVRCSSTRNDGNGIDTGDSCTLVNCTASNNGAAGIASADGSSIIDCTASFNRNGGFYLGSENTVRGCTAQANGDAGIQVGSNSQVLGNTCNGNRYGILVGGGSSRIDGNYFARNSLVGVISVGTGGNTIVRNKASGNGENFAGVVNDLMGPLVVQSSGYIESNSPWANFIH
jgi:parallel beta-helix repeat protein